MISGFDGVILIEDWKKAFAFSRFLYRSRNLVERFFAKVKQFRGIATCYDHKPEN